MLQLAQFDPNAAAAAKTTIDKLLDQGVLGIVVVIFGVMVAWLALQLLGCLKASAQKVEVLATTISTDTAAKNAQARAMEEMADRMERLERRFDIREEKSK